eukprot:gene17360-19095_t
MSNTSINKRSQNLAGKDEQGNQNEVCDSDVHCWKNQANCCLRYCSTFGGISVKLLALGYDHGLILSNNLKVYSVGNNDFGQLGLGDRSDRSAPREIGFFAEKNISDVVCGSRHSCALSTIGQVFCWGDSRQGQCGLGEKGIFTTPCKVNFANRSHDRSQSSILPKPIRIEKIACGDAHTIAIDIQGGLWSWGSGIAMGLGKSTVEALTPEIVSAMSKRPVSDISCGKYYSIALVRDEVDPINNRLSKFFEHLVIGRSSSEVDGALLTRTESNVTQKIPFLENVFYVESEEEASQPSLQDSQKSTRSDAMPVGSESEATLQDTDLDNEGNNVIVEEIAGSHEDVGQPGMSETISAGSNQEVRTRARSNTLEGLVGPLVFENKFYDSELAIKRRSSCPTLEKTPGIIIEDVVKDDDKIVDDLSTEDNREVNESLSAGRVVSATEIFFSAIDIPSSTQQYSLDNESSGSSSSDTSSEAPNEMQSSSRNPLHLDNEMQSMITSQSCPVVYDESAKKLPAESASSSVFSAKSSIDLHDVDKIGSSLEVTNSCQVWVWGEGDHGQLGLGSTMKRSCKPILLEALKDQAIIKISTGQNHVLALTRSCQVYGWGDNSNGQLGLNERNIPEPKIVDVLHGLRVWDISAGCNSSIFLADLASDSCDLYHLGKNVHEFKDDFATVLHTQTSSKRKGSSKKKRLSFNRKRSSTDSINSEWYMGTELHKMNHFDKSLVLRAVVGSDGQFACISETNHNQLMKIMHKLTSSERNYYHQIALIQDYIMTPLINTETWTSVLKLPGGEALLPLLDCFNDIIHSIRIGLWQLTDTVKKGLSITDLFSFFFSDSFRAVYDRYSKCYCDTLAVGHLHSLSKTVGHIISKTEESVKTILNGIHLEHDDFAALLKLPLRRSSYYSKCVEKITRCKRTMVNSSEEEINQLLQVVQRWQIFADETSKRLGDAFQTKKFWDESSSKLNEALKDPHRRLIKTSKDTSLNLARASRLTNHLFILFNDVFVHSQSSKHFQVFPLVTLWAEPFLDHDQYGCALKITAPEASFILTTSTHHERTEWVKELNKTIARCLSATSSHKITVDSVNSMSGELSAANAREASYSYINHQKYKEARYTGMWMLGLPHGRGQIKWKTGSTYEGEFVNGYFHGYGIMTFSNEPNGEERYEGDWVEGKMHGYGKMTYRDGHDYVGHWENNMRIGHGTYKSISKDRGLQTIYVGNWSNDQKHGYGVQEFIARGEKYIGMWLNNQRHGYGIVVTVDGVYCEGRFVQNKLVGKGLLLSDDDTCYEGEFSADMQLSGKGVLTMPNGDYFDGQFYGNWGEGIKINGTFNKFANLDPAMTAVGEIAASQLSLTDFSIPCGVKWKSLFDACRHELGGESEHVESVWKSIKSSVIKTRSSDIRRQSMRRRDLNQEFSPIEDPLKQFSVDGIRRYITNAIDTFGHPLNILVEALVEVYRATYVGVGAHRRLLLHAVEEAKSCVARLFSVVRLIFPSLPDEDLIILSHNKLSGEEDKQITSSTLFFPIILPRLYPMLFTLYALHTEKMDALYTERLHQLNKRGDVALMSFLGVDSKFLLVDFNEETKLPIKTATPPYGRAINELGTISTMYSPMEKIEVLKKTFTQVHKAVDEFWHGKVKLMAMDDLFPVFQYIVTRARVPHLGSEIQFIEDLVEMSILVGEMGHMVTTLKACFFQIQHEQDRE